MFGSSHNLRIFNAKFRILIKELSLLVQNLLFPENSLQYSKGSDRCLCPPPRYIAFAAAILAPPLLPPPSSTTFLEGLQQQSCTPLPSIPPLWSELPSFAQKMLGIYVLFNQQKSIWNSY